MNNEARKNPIHRALNKPLTIFGVERKLFFFSALVATGLFNFFGSLLGALLMFVVLFIAARMATAKDPQLLRILLNASKFKTRYDPAKQEPLTLKRVSQDA